MSFFDYKTPHFPLSSIMDYRSLAKKRLPPYLFEFIDGGASDEYTKKANSKDYQEIKLRKRVLKDVSHIETSVDILGQSLRMPLILAPIGFAGAYARRGELQAALAASKSNVPFCLSMVSISSMDEVQKGSSKPFWYQFYMMKERSFALDLLRRAKSCGCEVLVLTVDLPAIGSRHRYQRSMAASRCFEEFFSYRDWFIDVKLRGTPLILADIAKFAPHLRKLKDLRRWMSMQIDPSFTWKDLAWVRGNWPGKIVLKGIMDVEDAKLAADHGVEGIVVSNHGARHLDSTPSTIQMLPQIAEVVGDKLTVLVDGGITSSLDVVKALALGAKGCMIGRAWAYALAARGEEGVSEVLHLFHTELISIMTQLGVRSIQEIDRDILHQEGEKEAAFSHRW